MSRVGQSFLCAVLALWLLVSCALPAIGGALPELTVALTPSRDPTMLQEGGPELAHMLGQQLAMRVYVQIASDYAGVIEALRSQFVDLAFLPAVGYALASREAGARIVVKAMRGGRAYYTSRIFVLQESPISQLSDLRGKTIAFVDPASSSGYIYPLLLLMKEGLVQNRDPKTFLKETVFAGAHDAALLSLLNGSVDAAAAFDEAPERIFKDPAKAARFRAIAETPTIPNDGVAVRQGLTAELVEHITRALLALNAPAGVSLLRRLYNIDGLVAADDRDYDPVREAVDLLGMR
jgi:phosphonate transport system substrate-binding protein